jgi:hypothetical protein
VPYLAALAFPFLKIFGQDSVITFEIVVSILLNWAKSWLDELPGPPLKVLSRLDDLLASVDPMLHAHLRLACESPGIARSGAVHLAVLWPLLQSLLTEVLPKPQWLQLWDHLLTHWLEPELLLAAVCAFLKCCRASLLELPAHAPRAVEEWLRHPQKVHMPALIETMYALQAEAAAMALTPHPVVDPLIDVGPLRELPLVGAGPQLPLPRGRYPSISVYPHILAEFRGEGPPPQQENKRVSEIGEGGTASACLTSHRDEFLEVRTAVAHLRDEEGRFRRQQEELLKAEDARRQVAAQEEERLFEERRKTDDEIIRRRLASVRGMYEGVEKSLQQQQQLRAAEGKQLFEDLKRKHRQRCYDAEARMKEEAILNLEHKGLQTVTELLMKRRDEENAKSLEAHVRQRRREQELQDEVQRQAWRIEDEREVARLAAAREKRVQADQREAELRQRREIEMELRLEELERQLQLAQVARERVVRRTQQDAAFMVEASDTMQRRRNDLAARSERREQALAIAEERRFQRARIEEQQLVATREASRCQLDMEVRREQLSDLQADQVRRDYEARSRQLQAEDDEHDAYGQEVIRQALKSIDSARYQSEEGHMVHSETNIGNPSWAASLGVQQAASGAGSLPVREISPEAGRPSPTSPPAPAIELAEAAQRLQEPAVAGMSAMATPAGSALVSSAAAAGGSKTAVAVGASAAVVAGGSSEATPLRERQLEDLIRQRESELEALWQDFDDEAQQVTEEDNIVFSGRAEYVVEDRSIAHTRANRILSGEHPRESARSRIQESHGGGPLAGAWGDTSGESSSGSEAFRHLGSRPPGAARPPLHTRGRFSPPREPRSAGHPQQEHGRPTGVRDDVASASDSAPELWY